MYTLVKKKTVNALVWDSCVHFFFMFLGTAVCAAGVGVARGLTINH